MRKKLVFNYIEVLKVVGSSRGLTFKFVMIGTQSVSYSCPVNSVIMSDNPFDPLVNEENGGVTNTTVDEGGTRS